MFFLQIKSLMNIITSYKMNKISIVIPVYNEEENIKDLIDEINLSLKEKINYEIVIVNDGSSDKTHDMLIKITDPKLKIINSKKNLGQSKSIHAGIVNSSYQNIATIDGDGQNSPRDIILLSDKYFNKPDLKMVAGIRKKRKDNIIKIITSKIANYVRNLVLNDNCKDTGCSLKIFDKNIFLSFPYFNGIHRFLPSLFVGYGSRNCLC